MRVTVAALAGVCAACLGGCATYVNIPAQPGLPAVNNANDGTVQRISLAALQHVVLDSDVDEPYRVQLVDGSSDHTYNYVVARLPRGARPAPFVTDGPLFTVAAIRVRGVEGQVDITRPVPGGGRQLVTVYCKYYFDGWHARKIRPWQVPVGQAPTEVQPTPTVAPEPESIPVVEPESQ